MKTKIYRLFLSAALIMSCSVVSFAGNGTGTSKDPYSGIWETLDFAKIIKVGDTISLNCTICTDKDGYTGGSVTVYDSRLSSTEIVHDWRRWDVIGCLKDPYDNYKDYVAYNDDWNTHAFVVTKAEVGTAFGHTNLSITGYFTGYYNTDDYVAELEEAWDALPDNYKDVAWTYWFEAMCNTIKTDPTQSQAQQDFLDALGSILDRKTIPDAIAHIKALVADETNTSLLATANSYIEKLNNTQIRRNEDVTDITGEFTELHTAIMNTVSKLRDISATASTEITETEEYINLLKACTTVEQVKTITDESVKLLTKLAAYSNAGYSAALGDMGTEQKGYPAVKVTKGEKTILLYNPDEVELVKIPGDK